MSNVDINVDGRTDGRTDGLTDGGKIGRLYRTLLQAGAIKMVLVILSFSAQHLENRARNQNWSAWCQHNTAGWNIMLCLWHDISARQHSNSEPGAPSHIHTSLQYD